MLNYPGKFHHPGPPCPAPVSFSSCKYRILSPSTSKPLAILQVVPSKCPPIHCLPLQFTPSLTLVWAQSSLVSYLTDLSLSTLSLFPLSVSYPEDIESIKQKWFYSINQSLALLPQKPHPVASHPYHSLRPCKVWSLPSSLTSSFTESGFTVKFKFHSPSFV